MDSIVFNELGSHLELVKYCPKEVPNYSGDVNAFQPEKDPKYSGTAGAIADTLSPAYQVINLRSFVIVFLYVYVLQALLLELYSRYDLTPINNISVVATETGLIPPT